MASTAAVAAVAGVSAAIGAGAVALAALAMRPPPAPAPAPAPAPQPVVIDLCGGASREDSPATSETRETRRRPRDGTPINVSTRGAVPEYTQVGYLAGQHHADVQVNNILPLFGRQTHAGSTNWNFFTRTEAGVQIPIFVGGRDCTEDVPGCRELYDGDTVGVEALGGDYVVRLYGLQTPRYIPFFS